MAVGTEHRRQQSQVKEIVCECVKKLGDFCAHLEQLIAYFAAMHNIIQVIDEMRVDPFIQSAESVNNLKQRLSDVETDEKNRMMLE